MQFLTDSAFWVRWLQIVLIDLLLAGDNALVIALAVRNLPAREQFWGRVWGTAGAVVLRVSFIAMISFLLKLPLLQAAGGVVLIWIAMKLVQPGQGGEEGVRHGTTLREAIWLIVVADVAMSLDNVIAIAAAAKGDMPLVIFGLLLSLPLVVWGSGWLAVLMTRFRWIVWLGGAVLGYVAAQMIFRDHLILQWGGSTVLVLDHYVPAAVSLVLAAYGWLLERKAQRTRETAPVAPVSDAR